MPTRNAVSPLRLMGIALLFGLGWFAVELCYLVAGDAGEHLGELAREALRFLPWHLAAFAAIGAGGVLLSRAWPLTAAAGGWWVLFGAATLFLGVRVAEGVLHHSSLSAAVLRTALLVAALGVGVMLAAALGRVLPRRLRASWPRAAWAGAIVLLVGFLTRAGSLIALGELKPTEAFAQMRLGDLAIAAGVLALVLAGGAARGGASVALAILVAILPADARAETRSSDVYVFLLDTLREDHLGPGPDGSSRTPALDRIAPEFHRFRRAYSPSTRTSRALPGILTSLSVRVTGSPLPPEVTTLAEHLDRAGKATYGISANPQVSAAFGYQQGFRRLSAGTGALGLQIVSVLKLLGAAFPSSAYELGMLRAELYFPPIDQLRRRALALLDDAPGPTFVYAQTMDVHGPYLPPQRLLPASYRRSDFLSYHEFLRLSRSELQAPEFAPRLENLRQRYAGGVRFTDEVLAKWIEDLRARGRWDEALVWILSDHGEAFGEHGIAGHGYAYVGSPVIHVPLWVKLPRSMAVAPREIDAPVSAYDLLPTTLGLLGLPPAEPAFGIDLTPTLRGAAPDPERTVVVETDDGPKAALYSAIRGPWKLDVHYTDGVADAHRLHHVEQDPGETRDLYTSEPEVAASLTASLEAWRSREASLAIHAGRGKVDAETRERLRSLGYLD